MRLPQRWKYPQLREGLVGSWCPSQGASGDKLFDRSGYGNHGVLTNMNPDLDWIASGDGVALDFDGTNDHVLLSTSSDTFNFERTELLTFSAWINPNNITGVAYSILDKGLNGGTFRGWLMTAFNRTAVKASAISFFLTNTDASNQIEVCSPANSIAPLVWQHVAVTYDGSSLASGVRIYINGLLQANTVSRNNLSSTTQGTALPSIGARNQTAQLFPGKIDDTLIYKRALSQSEIQLLAQRRGTIYETMPARYRMRGSGSGPPATFTGRNMLVGCAF